MKRLIMLIMTTGVILSATAAAPAHAAINVFNECVGNNTSAVCKASGSAGEKNATGIVKQIINVLLYVLGVIAVLMIIWSGIKYTTSRGDPGSVKSAKDTMTYAVVGLIVALLAYAIVNFVVGALK